jgi:hypothetical protein
MARISYLLSGLLLAGSPAFAAATGVAIGDPAFAVRVAAAYGAVTSTYRSVFHNRAVGGVPNSYHLQNRAIDIARRPGVTHRQIELALRQAGYTLVESLDEGDHSHFAFGSAMPVRAISTGSATTGAVPPPPAPPSHPILAADEHGTLKLDIPAPAGAPAASAP